MVVCGLLIMITGLLDALFALLPPWEWTLADIPTTGTNITAWNQSEVVTSTTSGLTGPFSVIASTNRFVPIDHLLYAFQFLALIVVAALAFRGIRFVINVVRGAGA